MDPEQAHYENALRRMMRGMVALAAAGCLAFLILRGWRWAVAYLLGAAASYLNFRWLKRVVDGLGGTLTARPSPKFAWQACEGSIWRVCRRRPRCGRLEWRRAAKGGNLPSWAVDVGLGRRRGIHIGRPQMQLRRLARRFAGGGRLDGRRARQNRRLPRGRLDTGPQRQWDFRTGFGSGTEFWGNCRRYAARRPLERQRKKRPNWHLPQGTLAVGFEWERAVRRLGFARSRCPDPLRRPAGRCARGRRLERGRKSETGAGQGRLGMAFGPDRRSSTASWTRQLFFREQRLYPTRRSVGSVVLNRGRLRKCRMKSQTEANGSRPTAGTGGITPISRCTSFAAGSRQARGCLTRDAGPATAPRICYSAEQLPSLGWTVVQGPWNSRQRDGATRAVLHFA